MTIQLSSAIPLGILGQTHALHRRYYFRWFLYENFYRGGMEVLEPRAGTVGPEQVPLGRPADSYLFPHERESKVNFQRRQLLAYYLNFCWPAVEDNVAGVYRAEVQRELPFVHEDLLANVDGRGTDAHRFVQSMCRWACVYGHVAVVHDATPAPNAEILTRADEKSFGIRPYSYLVAPQDILDWQVDDHGKLDWIAFLEARAARRQPLTATPATDDTVYRIRILTREGWELREYKGSEKTGAIIQPGVWPDSIRGEVPVSFAYFRRVDDALEPQGESLLSSIADINREIFNECSLVQDIHYQVTFPQFAMALRKELSAEERKELSLHRYIAFDPDGPPPLFVSPDPSASDTLTRRIMELAAQIKQIAGLELGDVKQAQSGVALAWRHSGRTNLLAHLADQMEQAENEMWRHWARWLGADPKQGKVSYPDDYAQPAPAEKFAQAEVMLEKIVGTARRFGAEVRKDAARLYLAGKVEPEVLAEVEAEIDAEATKPLPEQPGQPGVPPDGAEQDAEDGELRPEGQPRSQTDVKADRDWMRDG